MYKEDYLEGGYLWRYIECGHSNKRKQADEKHIEVMVLTVSTVASFVQIRIHSKSTSLEITESNFDIVLSSFQKKS